MNNNVGRDLYEIVGIQRTATQQEIEDACLRLANQYRPDRNPNNPEAAAKFAAIENAYAVLSDPIRRAEYDRTCSYATARRFDSSSPWRRPLWAALLAGFTGVIAFGGWYVLGARDGDVGGGVSKPSMTTGQQTQPSKLAVDAYSALKKLQASTEVGITYAEYRRQLGETWHVVKTYLESAESKKAASFARAIVDAMQRYNNAAVIWQARIEGKNDYTSKYLKLTDCATFEREVCERGRRLLAEVPDIETFTDAQGRMTIPLEDELQRQWKFARANLEGARGTLK